MTPINAAPLHVAVIMDGNGRWARARSLPRVAGHRAGAQAVRRIVESAPDAGITTLTLYAFSADNWGRPIGEVRALMDLLKRYLRDEAERCAERGVRLSLIGRRDRLPAGVVAEIERAEHRTADAGPFHLRIAVDYSARDALLAAANMARDQAGPVGSRREFAGLLQRAIHSDPATPDVDLLIRTSGEQRLSDFLLWECAYAELWFTSRLWPDFTGRDLVEAVADFKQRDRRFGLVAESVGG